MVQPIQERTIPNIFHPAQRHQAKIAAQNDQQQQANPPLRHGADDYGADANEVIRPAAAIEGGNNAQGDANHNTDQ